MRREEEREAQRQVGGESRETTRARERSRTRMRRDNVERGVRGGGEMKEEGDKERG